MRRIKNKEERLKETKSGAMGETKEKKGRKGNDRKE